ncbi:LacI family DNA-binding transcriptional regulator [Alkalihalobacillus sp. 1P02AB]|uniref:LacI family DNA-binding transcriptional regulator n=1 Tax=Alkalihalobacillus sp. 1P02AB TaxID=3132260 RepID=UPI0039A6AEDF
MVTIKDIAKATNVSYSTVSKALNDSPLVKPETKQAIIAKAKQLGYTPNFAAKHLVTKRTNTIGLVWPAINRVALTELASQVNKKMREKGMHMLLSINDPMEAIELFSNMRSDGILLFEEDIAQNQLPAHLDIPLLSYGVPGINQFPTVGVKHEDAMELAVTELARQGHKKIGYVGIIDGLGRRQQTKQRGYTEAMQKRGLSPLFIPTKGLDVINGSQATTSFLHAHSLPEALICSSYDITIGTISALRQANLSFPRDLSLISYDNIPQLAELEVPVSAVGVPVEQLAEALVQQLLNLINGQFQQESLELSPELVIRKSSIKS